MPFLRNSPVPASTHRNLAAGLPLLLAVAACCLQAGCVTSRKYRLANASAPAAVPMNFSAIATPVDLTVNSVIVFKGPGSWKREARWDEYLVSLVNHGQQPATIESVELVDLLGQSRAPGDDPWKLEKLSRSNWSRYGKGGLKVVAGIEAATVYVASLQGVAFGSFLGGSAAAGGGAAAGLSVIPVLGAVDIAVVAVMNHRNKAKVQQEFQRRRINMPRSIEPGEVLAGSLYFPMTPGPQRMLVRGSDGRRAFEVVLDLQPLAGLHLKAKQ
jgi:hypothetical protein